jgi:hypothetical protein
MRLLMGDQRRDQVVTKVKRNLWPSEPMMKFEYLLTSLKDVVLAVNGMGKWVKVNPEPLAKLLALRLVTGRTFHHFPR